MALRDQYRVLVVEDDPDIRRILQLFLTERDFTVTTADRAATALDLMSQAPVDLILSDVRMPGMSGIETARRLTARDASTVVVLVTSGECSDVSRTARTCGAVALLAKQNLNPSVLRGIWSIHGPVTS